MPRLLRALPALLLASFLAAPALAFDPALEVQGRLTSSGGGPVADGKYLMLVALYDTVDAIKPVHEELQSGVAVQSGVFSLQVGVKQPFAPGLFATGKAAWLGVAVAGEPELPRVPLRAVPYAHLAAHAEALQCTGCVQAAHLDPQLLASLAKTVDLDAFAKKAELGDVARRDQKNVFQKPNAFLGPISVGKDVGGLCAFDVTSDLGPVCVDGSPAMLVLPASSAQAMDKIGGNGQVVYRSDENALYVKAGPLWRKLQYAVVCGDGAVDPPEECDDGAANADVADKCRKTCKKPACGDGIQDQAEQCDDGNTVSSDACVECSKAFCGDGKKQVGVEECDDGNNTVTDGCVACQNAVCGDGAVYVGVEECDDGGANADAPDKCRKSCKKPKCGDAIVDSGEQCDAGSANADKPNTCRTTCKNPTCGDKIVDSGEECDDGNVNGGDGCSATCKGESQCGAFDGGEKKLILVPELNQCLQKLGAKFYSVQYIEVAYGYTQYLTDVCKAFGYSSYSTTYGGDKCNSSAYMYPSYCGQGWLGGGCSNGCGNANYDGFYCQ